MDSQLTKILANTRRGVEERKAASSTHVLEQAAAAHQPRGFARALRQKAANGPAVIAELKKASPSRGLIRPDFDVATLAAGFADGGAAALSVLTEESFFQGSLRNLELASQSCSLPCLRKDFLLDEFQLLEARAHRADAILLIAAALSDGQLRTLAAHAHALELDVLCEVHTGEELDRVLDLDCDAIGVNNRDLSTFSVRLQVSLDLASRLPSSAVHVSESGIETAEDLNRLRAAGFHAFLIGESLMRRQNPGVALETLLMAAADPVSCHAALDGAACAPFHEERRIELADATNLDRKSGDRISCHAALDGAACAPFREERRIELANATNLDRKSGDRSPVSK